MDTVHVRSHDDQAQHAVDGAGQVDIGMIEECGRVQQNLKEQHRDSGRAKCCDGS